MATRARTTSTAAATTPILRARNLHRILGTGDAASHILHGVELAIEPHSYVAIVGASGSGKSTLLYLLGGLDRPSQGDYDPNDRYVPFDPPSRVFIDGRDTTELDDVELALLRNARIGFVFQFHYLLKEFTAQENVALPMLKRGHVSRSEALDRAAHLLDRLQLGGKLKRRANRLSGGEQQRVAIARALANEPAVILADEPTGNLDKHNSERVAEVFHELAAAGQTIVMVTHDPAFARRARRIITMEDGRIMADDRPPDGAASSQVGPQPNLPDANPRALS